MKVRYWLIAGMVVPIINGCTTDDPNRGGFFGGLVGLGSGAYERRITERTETRKAEEQRHQDELAIKRGLDKSLDDRRAKADDLERQVERLQEEARGLSLEIEALQSEEARTSNDVKETEVRVAAMLNGIDQARSKRSVGDDATTPGEAIGSDRPQQAEQKLLREEEEAVRAYILELQDVVDALTVIRDRYAEVPSTPGTDDTDHQYAR